MAGVQLIGEKAMNRIISHHQAVQWKVTEVTEEIGVKAGKNLAVHRDTGAARIETSYGETDGFVSLVDEAADPIEFGHFVGNSNSEMGFTYVPGLYIISRAAGIV